MSKKKKVYDSKKKEMVVPIPKEGYIAKRIRYYYDDLRNVPNSNLNFQVARKFAERCYKDFQNPNDSVDTSKAQKGRFRKSGAGRKAQAPEVRDSLFEWFVDTRGIFKGRLPKDMLVVKAKQLYLEWLKQQPEPPEKTLQFSNKWIAKWMKEYEVSLQKPNKRFSISNNHRKERIIEYLKNMWRGRKYFLDKHGKEPKVINGDQMPIHRNESSEQKTLNMKNTDCFVKENCHLARERATCFTQVCSDPSIKLPLEFVFKGKGESSD